MATQPGSDLRRRREALGWTVEQVAARLVVPPDVVRALEEGALHRLPPGPYAEGHARVYRHELDRAEASGPPTVPSWDGDRELGPHSLPTPDGDDGPPSQAVVTVHDEAARPERGVPLDTVRRIAAVSTGLALVLVAIQAGLLVRDVVARPAVDDGFVDVAVELRRTAWMRVEIDGRLTAHRQFAGGETHTWRGAREIALDVPAVDAVRVTVEGEAVAPRGRLDVARRLTFVRGGGP